MARELRGRIKQKLWVRPVCTDDSDTYRNGQLARADFKRDACDEDGAGTIDVASIDMLDEANEFGDQPFTPNDSW